jgi:hypothetical protein
MERGIAAIGQGYFVLDLDRFLLDPRFEHDFWLSVIPKAYSKLHQCTAVEACVWIQEEIHRLQGTLKRFSLAHWAQYTKLDLLSLYQHEQSQLRLQTGAERFLYECCESGVPGCVISQTELSVMQFKMRATGLNHYIDPQMWVSAHTLGVVIDDPVFLDRLYAHLAWEPVLNVSNGV